MSTDDRYIGTVLFNKHSLYAIRLMHSERMEAAAEAAAVTTRTGATDTDEADEDDDEVMILRP